MTQYIVIENTPGYMPESEPVTFSDFTEAMEYARREALECAYQSYEPEPVSGAAWTEAEARQYVSESFTENAYARFDICSDQPHDLGRVIEVTLAV